MPFRLTELDQTPAAPPAEARTYTVHVIPQQQYRDGEPFDIFVDNIENEIIITDPRDDRRLVRCVRDGILALERDRRAA